MCNRPSPQNRLQKSLSDGEFEKIVRKHTGRNLAVANRILKDSSLAEDAVQQAFAKLHEKYDTFEGRADLATWIHRITVNEALMILRRTKRLNESSIENMLPEFDRSGCRIEHNFESLSNPEQELQSQQTHIVVTTMIDKLPTQYRIVLVLRDIEEMTTAEVAIALDISIANVKTRLHRARSALKRLMKPHFDGGAL